jgi:hypothetical protein
MTELHVGQGSPLPYSFVPIPLNVAVPPLETLVLAALQRSQKSGYAANVRQTFEQYVPVVSVIPRMTRDPQLVHFSNMQYLSRESCCRQLPQAQVLFELRSRATCESVCARRT